MSIKETLASSILEATQKAIDMGTIKAGKLPEVLLTVPPQKEFGDFATNFAMQAAKALHCSPRVLAQALVDNLSVPYVERTEIAGPGFINFYLKQDWLYKLLEKIVKAGDNYGNLQQENPEKIQLEYVSANPTGPLHDRQHLGGGRAV